jgi:hypothetical protein
VLGQRQRVGDAAFALLVGVVNVLQPELFAVGQKPQEIARIPAARDHQDVVNAGVHQRLNGVINHRPVVNGQQMLVRDFGQRKEPATRAAGEYNAFHKPLSYQRSR